jgi:hypothetical protein
VLPTRRSCESDFRFKGGEDLDHMGASIAGFGDWDANGHSDVVMGGLRAGLDEHCPVPEPYLTGSTKVWISFGPQSCLCPTPPCSPCEESGANLVVLQETQGSQSRFGHDVCFVGDLNPAVHAGHEIAISAPTRDNGPWVGEPNSRDGTVYVLFLHDKTTLLANLGYGPFDPESTTLIGPPGSQVPVYIPGVSVTAIRGPLENGWFGHSIAACGNVIGDATPDLLVGAPEEGIGDEQVGRAYVIDGRRIRESAGAVGGPPGVMWADMDNSKPLCLGPVDPDPGCQGVGCCATLIGNSRVLAGTAASRMGYAVSGVGDLDLDGYNEFAASAPEIVKLCPPEASVGWFASLPGARGYIAVVGYPGGAWSANATPVHFVKILGRLEDNLPSTQFLTHSESSFVGRSLSGFGASAAAPQGDILESDGIPDLLIGAPFADKVNGSEVLPEAGSAYIVSGAQILNAVSLYGGVVSIDVIAGVHLRGAIGSESFGWSVAGGGRLNNDYVPEFAVGSRSFVDANCPTCLPPSVPPCYCAPPANPPQGAIEYQGALLGRATVFCGATLQRITQYIGEQFRERLGYDIAWLGFLSPDPGAPGDPGTYTELGVGGMGWATYCLDPGTCLPTPPTCRAEQGCVSVFLHQESP